jgi:hypothetical protein
LLQENLKRVFMRGVCALNFEAMTLLSDGTAAEPSGMQSESLAGHGAAPPLPAAPSFDWSQFEASTAGDLQASGGSAAPTLESSQPPAGTAAGVLESVDTNQDAVVSRSESDGALQMGLVQAAPSTAVVVDDVAQARNNSPRQPPVPSPHPQQMAVRYEAPPSLPFVNWSNPMDASSTTAVPFKAPLPRPGIKSQRWQTAIAPRGSAPRSEMIMVG